MQSHFNACVKACRMNSAAQVIALVVLGLASGCAYTTTRPFPEGIQTIHVELAQSREFRRDLEFELTEALVKRIEMDTPYRVCGRRDADSVLSCEVLEVQNRGFADDFRTERPREIGSTIYIRFRWKDLRNGKMLVERPRFGYTVSYLPPVGETFRKGMVRGMDGLAEQIVEAMESPWSESYDRLEDEGQSSQLSTVE